MQDQVRTCFQSLKWKLYFENPEFHENSPREHSKDDVNQVSMQSDD